MTVSPPAPSPSPQPGDGDPVGSSCRGHLQERPGGWTLTLTINASALAALVAMMARAETEVDLGALEMSVTPNLVPGEPFAVEEVTVIFEPGHELVD